MKRAEMRKEINNVKKRIVEEFRPEKIVLFGSYAYGKPAEHSDIDVLVILPFKGLAAKKAVEILGKISPTIPLDLIVRTPAQVRKRIAQNDFFMRDVIARGKVLYEASH